MAAKWVYLMVVDLADLCAGAMVVKMVVTRETKLVA